MIEKMNDERELTFLDMRVYIYEVERLIVNSTKSQQKLE